jgi:flagellar biosynthetic protein FliR
MLGAIPIDSVWLLTVFLLSLRLTAVFTMTPLLAAASVPPAVRVLLVLGLAAALSLGLPAAAPTRAAGVRLDAPGALLAAGFTELALGATLSLGVLVAFAAFNVAGRLLDVQIGFGLGQVIDPASNASQPVLTSAFSQLSVLVFFLVDGHHALLRGVAYSLERFPLGRPWPVEAALAPLVKQVGGLLGLGFALAAPVAFSLLLLEMALGVIARNLPQVNMLVMGIPAKIVVGLLALSLWFGGVGDVMSRVYGGLYRTWDALLADDGGAR